jgi:hypothetical protein
VISPRRRLLVLLLLALPACRRDPPPPAPPAPALADAGTAAEASPTAAASAEVDDADVHVLEEGREPRAVVRFAFVPGRREARVLEIDSHVELHDKPRVHEHVTLRFDLRYAAADAIELTLRRAETTAADIPLIGTTVGATFKQKIGADGATDKPEATFPAGADGTAKEYVQGAVVQIATTLVPRVPSTPIGEGARWRWGRRDAPVYRLESMRDGRIAVEVTSAIHGKRRLENRKTVPVNEDQTTHLEASLDGIARHVSSTLVADRSSGPKLTTEVHFDSVDKL